jgi:membrane protease YdiL (CAAX protease family)
MTRLALLFYGACIALAFLWGALAGRPWLLLLPVSPRGALLGAVAGLGLGLAVVLLTRALLRWSRLGRELFDWFAGLLGPLTAGQALLLAALSAAGEELLFRGAMQPSLGLWLTSLVFALLHFPGRLRLWPWTLSAGLLGLGFGFIAERSAHLGGPLLAHFIINALNLAEVGRRAHEQKLPGPGAPPSIESHGEGGSAPSD